MAINQAKFLKLNAGEVKENQLANLMIVDLNAQTRVSNQNRPLWFGIVWRSAKNDLKRANHIY